jgi:hypothetical protein
MIRSGLDYDHDLTPLNPSCRARHIALEEALGELVCQWRIPDAKCKKPIHAD